MKKTLAALILTVAIATPAITPAMAQTYMQSMLSRDAVQAQRSMGYSMPPGWDSSELQSPVFARDPDPSVRQQLQIQSDITDR